MVMAAELSRRLGLIGQDDVARVRKLVARAGLPWKGPALSVEKLLELMAIDKKSARGQVRFVLLDSIGRARLAEGIDERVAREAIVAALQ